MSSRFRSKVDVLLLPTSAKTVSQEEIDALEAKRIRRLRELGDWRPSSGFHIEPQLPPEPALQSTAPVRSAQVAFGTPTETALRPDAELNVLEGRDEAATPRRIRARRAVRSSNATVVVGLNGLRFSLHRG